MQPNQRFNFELGRSGQNFRLTVTDRASYKVVMEAIFTPEHFADLMSARITSGGVPVWFLPEEYRAGIGKYLASVSRRLTPQEAIDKDTVPAWANDITRFAIPAEYVEVRPKGGLGGFDVVLNIHFDTEEQADRWAEDAREHLKHVPTPRELRDRLAAEEPPKTATCEECGRENVPVLDGYLGRHVRPNTRERCSHAGSPVTTGKD